MSGETFLAQLSLGGATLARSVLARVSTLGTVSERTSSAEVAFIAHAAPEIELPRLVLRQGGLPRLVYPATAGHEPLEIDGLPAAATAAEAVRAAAARATSKAPQLDLFGGRR